MRTQIWNRFAILVIVLVAALLASPTGRVAGQIMGDLPTNWFFPPAGVTNLQVVRLAYANTLPVPVFVNMAIVGGKVVGTSWNPKTLASQQNVVVSSGQGTVLTLNWNAVGGLASGERAQVFGRLTVTPSALAPVIEPVASLEISDLLGLAITQIANPCENPAAGQPVETVQDFHFNPVIVTNAHAVRLSFYNPHPVPVRINAAILGGKMTGTSWNAATVLASQKDLLVGPGQGTVLTLNWNAAGGLATGERAQVYGRLTVAGVISPRDAVASMQVQDLLGLFPARALDPISDPAR